MEEKEQETKTPEEIAQEEKDSARLRKIAITVVVGFIIIFFLALFGIKYLYQEDVQDYPRVTYNGFEFTKIAGTWYTQWQNEEKLVSIALRYNPYETENITLLGEGGGFNRSEVYITFDPYSEQEDFKYLALAAAELSQSISKAFSKQVIPSCTREHNETCEEIPVVTCQDTDKSVIELRAEEPAQILLNGNCIVIQGKEFEIVRAADKLLYLWYKII